MGVSDSIFARPLLVHDHSLVGHPEVTSNSLSSIAKISRLRSILLDKVITPITNFDEKAKIWAVIPATPRIPTNVWFDPLTIDSPETYNPPSALDFSIAIPAFLAFASAIDQDDQDDHKYQPTVLRWINAGHIRFNSDVYSRFGPSLHVDMIDIKKTGLWSLSDFMTLDALIHDYLVLAGIALESEEPKPEVLAKSIHEMLVMDFARQGV
jgi:hypothetical protein